MAYFLKLLLQKGKTVIYEARKDDVAFAFIPHKRGGYRVWMCLHFNPNGCSSQYEGGGLETTVFLQSRGPCRAKTAFCKGIERRAPFIAQFYWTL